MNYREIAISRRELTQEEVEMILNERRTEINRIKEHLSRTKHFTELESQTAIELFENDTDLLQLLFSKLGYNI